MEELSALCHQPLKHVTPAISETIGRQRYFRCIPILRLKKNIWFYLFASVKYLEKNWNWLALI